MFLNKLKKSFNFIFPPSISDVEKVKTLLENRIFWFPKEQRITFFPYNTLTKKIIYSIKFHHGFREAKFLGKIFYENLPSILEDLKISENFNDPILITIPLPLSRKIKRGYNQNDLILKYFFINGGNIFINAKKNILVKKKYTSPQTKQTSKTERFQNIKNSFKLKTPEKIKGKNILLFDDLITTGATLNEAKKVLKKAGAKKVIFLTIAH